MQISILKSFLSPEEINQILAHDLPLTEGTVSNHEHDTELRLSGVGWLAPSEWEWLVGKLTVLAKANRDIPLTPLRHLQFSCYETQGHYTWHQDAYEPQSTRTREVSIVIMLSPAEAGGVLEIEGHPTPDMGAGDIIVFPSTMNHRVTPVTKGQRKSIATWFERENIYSVTPNVFSPHDIVRIVGDIDPSDVHSSVHNAGTLPQCSHQIAWLLGDPWRWVYDRLEAHGRAYCPHSSLTSDNIMYAEYGEGQEYLWHPDSEAGAWTESRRVSMIVVLEAPDSGGEFQIRELGTIPLRPGSLLVFDSEMVHRVTAVTQGIRKSMVFWMRAV